VFVLGRRFSGLVAIQPGHTLVTSGVYGVIRHPSYLGMLVNSLGWELAFRAGVGVLLTLVTIPPLLARIRAQEKLLSAHFGAKYDKYRARTSRLIPGLYERGVVSCDQGGSAAGPVRWLFVIRSSVTSRIHHSIKLFTLYRIAI
jgi:hypothetical protein